MTIGDCLQRAVALAGVSDSPRLDLEVLLARVLGRDRAYLYTWPERTLSVEQQGLFDTYFHQRLAGHPIAHILGEKEFWSLSLKVSAATLIPRPETEHLVARALQLLLPALPHCVADLGTGTGAIALALARERPQWRLFALDKFSDTVSLAEENRLRLALDNVTVQQSDWLSALGDEVQLDMVVSNPPYIRSDDPHLQHGDVRFEPRSALVAAEQGLADINNIAQQACLRLKPGGWLLLEHGFEQGTRVREILTQQGFERIVTGIDMAGLDRITEGQLPY